MVRLLMDMHAQQEEPLLQDGELRLRPARLPDDIPLAEPWYSDPEVMRLSEGDENASYDAAMIGKMYEYLAQKGELYIIERFSGEQWVAIGDVTLAPDTMPIVIGLAEFRSRGYGKRIIRLLVERAKTLGWPELRIKSVKTYNPRSKRLFESLGFEQDGDVFIDEGEPCWKFIKRF
jgi:RimJ/RimL family protein N-acetyltransferase